MGIKIDDGAIELTVNDDPQRIIRFNPNDIVFAEKVYDLIRDFEIKEVEYGEKAKMLDEEIALDAYGIPINTDKKLGFLRELCEYMRAKIDDIFGAGTSTAAFGSVMSIDIFVQFFEAVTPYIQKAREQKTSKYSKIDKQNRAVLK